MQTGVYHDVSPSVSRRTTPSKQGELMNKDIALLLHGWDYNPNEVTVRKVIGVDGIEKIQMRLDLGLLQMELIGRPDGKRPHGEESLLEYLEARREVFQRRGEDLQLSADEVSELKQEAMQYYYRYLSLFHLGDYVGVMRDTQRNLQVFDLVRECGEDDEERFSMEQFRPYVLMMNTRARSCLLLEEQEFDVALEKIDAGIARIEAFFMDDVERPDLAESCREIAFLRDWKDRILSNRPLTPQEKIKRELKVAIEAENYERAAQLRDALRELVA